MLGELNGGDAYGAWIVSTVLSVIVTLLLDMLGAFDCDNEER